MPDRELIRLAAAGRAGGSRVDGIAAACGVRDDRDITGVVSPPCWNGSDTGADLLFSAAQHAVQQVTGSRGVFAGSAHRRSAGLQPPSRTWHGSTSAKYCRSCIDR